MKEEREQKNYVTVYVIWTSKSYRWLSTNRYLYVFQCCRWISSAETNDTAENDLMLVPRIPAGVSGTALAASLLRDGWSVSLAYLFQLTVVFFFFALSI